MKELFFKIYMLGFLVLTVFFMFIIWKVTFAHIIEERQNRQEIEEIKQFKKEMKKKIEKTTFEKVIIESEERIKHYLGYKILEEQRIEGHFHHIGFDIGPDKRNYCITCHGDIPHDAVRDLRAFLNMHAYFISCQTCHVRLEGEATTGVYKWYDRATGEIIASPVQTSIPGTYRAKIVPFERVGGKLTAIDSQERIDFASEFREREATLSQAQKSRAKKLIHKIVSKQPHICEDCHQSENPLLPLEDLGYPKERKDSILGTEVVGMIKKYTEFYMPKMLQPGEAKKTEQ
jgi:hypothetical protein